MSQRIRMVIEVAELRHPDDCEKANELVTQLMQMDEAKCSRYLDKILLEAPPVMPAIEVIE